ncbi:MAG: hypothetical protein ACE5JV_01105 [Nitrososphaerales archaeon]
MIPIFTQKRHTDLKERTCQAISDLETEIKAMYSLRSRLQSSVNDALASAMSSYDKEQATRKMEDYDELANLLNIVRSAEMLLQNLSVKIDSTRYLQELVTILDRAMVSLRVIKSDISGIVPAIDTTLDMITNSIVEIRTDLKIEEEEISVQNNGSELSAVIAEVAIELPSLEKQGKPASAATAAAIPDTRTEEVPCSA